MTRPFKTLSKEQLRTLTKEQRKEYLKKLFKAAYAQLESGSWEDEIEDADQFRQIVSFCIKKEPTLKLILKRVPEEFSKGIRAVSASLQAAPGSDEELQPKVDELVRLDEAEKEAARIAEQAERQKLREEKKKQAQIGQDQDKINRRIRDLGPELAKQGGAIYAGLYGDDDVLLILGGMVYEPMGSGLGTRVSKQPPVCYLLRNMSGTFQAGSQQVKYEDAIGATSTGISGLAYQEKKSPRSGTYISLDVNQSSGPHPLLQMPARAPVTFYGTAVLVTGMGDLQLSNGRQLRRGRYPDGDDRNLTVSIPEIRDVITIAGSGLRVDGSTLMHLDDQDQFTQTSAHIESDPDWYAFALADRLKAGMINGDDWADQNRPYFYIRFQPQGLNTQLHVSLAASYMQVVNALSLAISNQQQCAGALNALLSPGLHVTVEASYGAQNLGIYPAGAAAGLTGVDNKIRRYVIRDIPTWNNYLGLTVNSTQAVVDQAAAVSPIWGQLRDWANTLITQAQQRITVAALTRMLAP